MTSRLILSSLLVLPLLASAAPDRSLAAALQASAHAAPAAPLQMSDLAARARIRDTALSPDGRQLAWLEADGKGQALNLLDLGSKERRPLAQLGGRAAIFWSRDGSTLFVDGGDALSAVDVRTGTLTRISELAGPHKRSLVKADPVRAHHALVTEQAGTTQNLLRIGAGGAVETLYSGRPLEQFLLAPDGTLAFGLWTDAGQQVLARRSGASWTGIGHCPQFEPCTLISSSPDGAQLQVLTTVDGNRRGLVAIDAASGKRRALFDDPDRIADTIDIAQQPFTGEPMLARLAAPRRHVAAVSPDLRRAADDIGRRFAENNVALQLSAGPWLIEEYGARLPQARYWLYDRATHAFTNVLDDVRDAGKPLAEAQLAATVPVSYQARDGATVYGYLTLPPGRKAGEVPLLTMVHGGPWARVDNGYSSLTQLIASRGVAVFAPNFRASTGHGAAYMRAPGARFGNGPAQTDIIDGVRWLQSQGVGDPKRLAIMGDSFGGYATLLALTNEPELFQFGMAMSPPIDFGPVIASLAKQVPMEAARMRYVGLDGADAAVLAAIAADAPLVHAARIQRPLYLIAGGKDDKVPSDATRSFAEALHARGIKVSLLLDPEEGHFPRKPVAREAYVYAIESLLHRYFGTAAPAAPSAAVAGYMKQNTVVCCSFQAE